MTQIAEVDAGAQRALREEQARAFRASGLLVLRNLVGAVELAALQAETLALVERAASRRVDDWDYQYKRHPDSGAEVPFRIEYVADKSPAARALLGHPFVLRSVEVLQGPAFIPTWDSMVFKLAGAGAAIEWHRDADSSCCDPERPIFNVDIYLDASDETNCVWGVPGSNRWSDSEAKSACERLRFERAAGAVPIAMRPGDALLHDILVVHGSPACASGLRRVLYYEFRPIDVEHRLGPHTPDYVPRKQRVLLACLRDRVAAAYARGEEAYCYRPGAPFDAAPLAPGERLASYRVPHHEHWRWDVEEAKR